MNSVQFNSQILTLSDKLYRFAKSILRNDNDAMDAVQDLNLKMWEKRGSLDDVENIPAYTMRAMRNLCLDILRKNHENIAIKEDSIISAMNPHQQIEQKDLVSRIRLMIDNLPELQRSIIRMRDVEGMEISEITFILSITENAVCVNLSRARQKIRDKIMNEQKRVEENIWIG